MASLIVRVNHRLPQDEALRRVKNRIAELRLQYSNNLHLSENWSGYVLMFAAAGKGNEAQGNVWVNPSDVIVQGQLKLSGLASFFESQIEPRLRAELIRILS
jgi:Putative polyhydroxyalkanoic acid system protein (PHA_gran_rgn)